MGVYWRRQWHPTPVLLPGKSMDGGAWWAAVYGVVTKQLHFHFSLSCIGEGNGNPLQYSCLENPRDGGAWWAAIYVAQSQTRPKQLSSSSMGVYIYMASLTQTWVWASSGSWWWTGKPGMLQSMGSQRVGMTEQLNWWGYIRIWKASTSLRLLLVLLAREKYNLVLNLAILN